MRRSVVSVFSPSYPEVDLNTETTARGKRTTLWISGSRSRDRYGGPPYSDPGRLLRTTAWIPRRRDAVSIFKPSYPCGGMDIGTGTGPGDHGAPSRDHLPDGRRLGRCVHRGSIRQYGQLALR